MVPWKKKEAAIRALEENGKVSPTELIEEARAKEHPCHNDFTWDVAEAAWKCWRDEAKSLIRKCKLEIIIEDAVPATIKVAAFVALPDCEEDLFTSLTKIRSVTTVSHVLIAEINQLHGLAARVYGIALAKQAMVDASVVSRLSVIHGTLAAIKEEMAEAEE
jgi:hypothetical protein